MMTSHKTISFVLLVIFAVLLLVVSTTPSAVRASAGQACSMSGSSIVCTPGGSTAMSSFSDAQAFSEHGRGVICDPKAKDQCWMDCDSYLESSGSQICECDPLSTFVRFGFKAANKQTGICPQLQDLKSYSAEHPQTAHLIAVKLAELCQTQARCKCRPVTDVHALEQHPMPTSCKIVAVPSRNHRRTTYLCNGVEVKGSLLKYLRSVETRPSCFSQREKDTGKWSCAGMTIENPSALPWYSLSELIEKNRRTRSRRVTRRIARHIARRGLGGLGGEERPASDGEEQVAMG